MRGWDAKIADAFASKRDFKKSHLKLENELELDKHLKEIKDRIVQTYPTVEDIDWELEEDAEHNSSKINYRFRESGRSRSTTIDFDFLNSPDFVELKKLCELLSIVGAKPYNLNDETIRQFPTLDELCSFILEKGKKGA